MAMSYEDMANDFLNTILCWENEWHFNEDGLMCEADAQILRMMISAVRIARMAEQAELEKARTK